MSEIAQRLHDNLDRVRVAIDQSARRSGRTASDVTLVGVTKYVEPHVAAQLAGAGCLDLGESRPQSLWQKASWFADAANGGPDGLPPVRWHLIGHLQRNKVARTVPLTAMIHSVDSPRIAQAIHESCSPERKVKVLLEVNISGDASKHGWIPDELESFLPRLGELSQLEVVGLMGMASIDGGLERARENFRELRQLRERLKNICPSNVELRELSMGMSQDFEAAIEEGATMVRVGSALFEGCL